MGKNNIPNPSIENPDDTTDFHKQRFQKSEYSLFSQLSGLFPKNFFSSIRDFLGKVIKRKEYVFSMDGASLFSGLALPTRHHLLCNFSATWSWHSTTRSGIGPASSQLHQNRRQARFQSRLQKSQTSNLAIL